MIPHQKHKKARASRSNKQDHSKGAMSSKRMKANMDSGVEGTTGRSDKKGMAKNPKGTPIAAPGGRKSRAGVYG